MGAEDDSASPCPTAFSGPTLVPPPLSPALSPHPFHLLPSVPSLLSGRSGPVISESLSLRLSSLMKEQLLLAPCPLKPPPLPPGSRLIKRIMERIVKLCRRAGPKSKVAPAPPRPVRAGWLRRGTPEEARCHFHGICWFRTESLIPFIRFGASNAKLPNTLRFDGYVSLLYRGTF